MFSSAGLFEVLGTHDWALKLCRVCLGCKYRIKGVTFRAVWLVEQSPLLILYYFRFVIMSDALSLSLSLSLSLLLSQKRNIDLPQTLVERTF